MEEYMFNRLVAVLACGVFFFCFVRIPYAQELTKESGPIIEEDIKAEPQAEKPKPQFITVDVLKPANVEPALIFYIRDDINKKFSGLITNLKLGKIYGIFQEGRTASVYFDYSYTSMRNTENILYEKGKMTFIRFNSGKWFNAELSLYLMDSYSTEADVDKQTGEDQPK